MKKILCFFLMTLMIIVSCSKSAETKSTTTTTTDCSGVPQSFLNDVNPIIETNCATNSGCHGAGSLNGPGPLLTYSEIFSARANISGAVSTGVMPLGGSLTTAQKNSIICWISSGAINN